MAGCEEGWRYATRGGSLGYGWFAALERWVTTTNNTGYAILKKNMWLGGVAMILIKTGITWLCKNEVFWFFKKGGIYYSEK